MSSFHALLGDDRPLAVADGVNGVVRIIRRHDRGWQRKGASYSLVFPGHGPTRRSPRLVDLDNISDALRDLYFGPRKLVFNCVIRQWQKLKAKDLFKEP